MCKCVCQCDSNCLLMVDLTPEAKLEFDDNDWFIISDDCKRGPEPTDVFVKRGPGYRIFTFLDTLGKTEKELLDEKFKEIIDEVKKMKPGQNRTFDLPFAIDFKTNYDPLWKAACEARFGMPSLWKGQLSEDGRRVKFFIDRPRS